MKNIHVLPTDKPSKLYKEKCVYKLDNLVYGTGNQNIYIINDEEIKKGDYMLTPHQGVIKWEGDNKHLLKEYCKKVILTTDKDLIKDGVQPIDDEFLEWFVKNPNCEFVEVERTFIDTLTGKPIRNWSDYKIIIPKEKPKQETLEEAAEKIYLSYENNDLLYGHSEELQLAYKAGIVDGAKWQQEQDKNLYSEEETIEIAKNAYNEGLSSVGFSKVKFGNWFTKWFKQFKNKQ